ncbi:MAG: DUF4132 domain-containing protein [Bradymonadaceae bacterium]|nr:DUF4132 domain-containing protein [Lujinxingiaceae bacterium]
MVEAKHELVDTAALVGTYRASANPLAQARAILALRYSPEVLIATLRAAVAGGEVVLAMDLAVELYVMMAGQVVEMLPLLEMFEGDAFSAFEARLDRLACQEYPNKKQATALFLALGRFQSEQSVLDLRFDELFNGLVLRGMDSPADGPLVKSLHRLLRSLPEARREKLVLSYSMEEKSYTANWLAVETCPTQRVIAVCVAEVVSWDDHRFVDCEALHASVVHAFLAFGAAAVSLLMEALAGKGAKCAQREMLIRALGETRCPQAAPIFGKFLGDALVPARQAAVEALLALGEAALPQLEAALNSPKKGVRDFAVETLSARGEEILPALWPLLVGPVNQVASVATILGNVASTASVPYLTAAFAAEENPGRQAHLRAAIKACQFEEGTGNPDNEAVAKLDRTLDELVVTKPGPFEPTTSLRWIDGEPVPQDSVQALMSALRALGPAGPGGALASMAERLDAPCRHVLAEELVGEFGWEPWVIYAVGMLGSELLIDRLGSGLQELVHQVSAHRANHGVSALVQNGSLAAVRWLDHWARKAKSRMLKQDSCQALADLMKREGLSEAELGDRASATFGFSANGELAFDYAGRALTLVLDAQNNVLVRDENSVLAARLPTVRKDQDAEQARAAAERFKALKKAVGVATKQIVQRLEEAMIVDRRWPLARWQAFFLQNPLIYGLTRGLVFATHDDPTGANATLFFVTDEGLAVDERLDPLALEAPTIISIPHPISLSDAQRKTWAALHTEAEISQPFAQLERELVIDAAPVLEIMKGSKVAALAMARSLARMGYRAASQQEGSYTLEARRELSSEIEIVLSHSGYDIETRRISPDAMLEIFSLEPRWSSGTPDRPLPPGVYSETVRDLRVLLA